MAIPRYEYPGEKFNYIRLSDIPDALRIRFSRWMYGQTVPLVPGLEPQDAVYEWDWTRWCRSQLTGIEPIWD